MTQINSQLPPSYTLPTDSTDTGVTEAPASQASQASDSTGAAVVPDKIPGAHAFAAKGSTLAKPVPVPGDVKSTDSSALPSGREKLAALRRGTSVTHQALQLGQEAQQGLPKASKQVLLGSGMGVAGATQAKSTVQQSKDEGTTSSTSSSSNSSGSESSSSTVSLSATDQASIQSQAADWQGQATSSNKCKKGDAGPNIAGATGLDSRSATLAAGLMQSDKTSQYGNDLALALAGLAHEKATGAPSYKEDKAQLQSIIASMHTSDNIEQKAGDSGNTYAENTLDQADTQLQQLATKMGVTANGSTSATTSTTDNFSGTNAQVVNPYGQDDS